MNINKIWLLSENLLIEGVDKFVPKNVLITKWIEINGSINYQTE